MTFYGHLTAPVRVLRDAWRSMRRNPVLSMVSVFVMALGIGSNIAVFAVVNATLIRPLPYPDSNRLVGIWHSALFERVTGRVPLSSQMYATYLENDQTFQDFGVWHTAQANISGLAEPEQVESVVLTHGTLRALAIQPRSGRLFTPEDDSPGSAETVILSYGYWQRRFGGTAVLGRTLTVDGRLRQIVGVMPPGFRLLNSRFDVMLPQRFERAKALPDDFIFRGIARLKPGVSLAQANADVARMLPLWIRSFQLPASLLTAFDIAPAVGWLKGDAVGNVGAMLRLLMGSIGIVLLIACANVASLLLVRTEGRQREIAVRFALGAGFGRLARAQIMESVLLSLLGGGLGLSLAQLGLKAMAGFGPANFPRLSELSVDATVVGFSLAVSLLAGLVFALAPVLRLRHYAHSAPPNSRAGLPGRGPMQAIVIGQIALSFVLLVSAALVLRSVWMLRGVQPGFANPDQVQTVRIYIPEFQVPAESRVISMQREIADRIAALNGVTSAAFASSLPMENGFENFDAVTAETDLGKPGIPPVFRAKFVSPGLLSAQGTPLVAGRDFTWTEVSNAARLALVSENVARATWGEPASAIGKRIRTGTGGEWFRVIGVAGDVFENGLHQNAPGVVYWPAKSRSVAYLIRSPRSGSESLVGEVRAAVWTVNPQLPVTRSQTLGDVHRLSTASDSQALAGLSVASSMALFLAIIGVYGAMSHLVSGRRREVGIRIALGAERGAVAGIFLRRGFTLGFWGISIGVLGAAALARLMSSLLFVVTPFDPMAYAGAALVLLFAALSAAFLPARRAANVDPATTLRAD